MFDRETARYSGGSVESLDALQEDFEADWEQYVEENELDRHTYTGDATLDFRVYRHAPYSMRAGEKQDTLYLIGDTVKATVFEGPRSTSRVVTGEDTTRLPVGLETEELAPDGAFGAVRYARRTLEDREPTEADAFIEDFLASRFDSWRCATCVESGHVPSGEDA